MKGIILAGGSGTRLYPLTSTFSKQLLPIYNKPLIYYPLSTLMLAGIKDILIISTENDKDSFKNLLGDGSKFGCNFVYKVQKKPNGIGQAFIIGKDFISDSKVALILGDNIFYGSGIRKFLKTSTKVEGAYIFAYEVQDPKRFGVVEFDKNNNVLSIEEKPLNPRSNFAIPGLYFYDNNVVEIAKNISPSERGEYEITDINKEYLKNKSLKVRIFNRGTTWFDTGTFESLSDASHFIRLNEQRQKKISCIEEVAYKMKFISKNQLSNLVHGYKESEYKNYLLNIISGL